MELVDHHWHIHAVSLLMEGKHFLSRYYPNLFPTGLCMLDTTEMGMQRRFDMFINNSRMASSLDWRINFAMDASCIGAIEIFTVLIFFSSGELFNGYCELIAKSIEGPVLDVALLNNQLITNYGTWKILYLKKALV